MESFFDFLWTGLDDGVLDGEGSGAGKNGHGSNGPPHRSKFPVNDDELNLDSVEGIEPFRLLFETLKLNLFLATIDDLIRLLREEVGDLHLQSPF